MDNNRRRFFGGLGALGVAVGVGVPVTAAAVVAMANRKNNQLQAPSNNSLATLHLYNESNSIVMSVGKDNMLWVKTNDEWKRLAVES